MSFETDNNRVINDRLRKAMTKVATLIQAEAVKRCPAVTGRLRQSIKIFKADEKEVIVGSNLYYAPYVEYGTRAMIKAHGEHDVTKPVTTWKAKEKRNAVGQTMPFLRPAVYFNREKIKKIIGDALEKK